MKNIIVLLLISFLQLYAFNKVEKFTIIKAQKLIELGKYKKALNLIDNALKKYPKSDQLLTLQGKAYKEDGKLNKGLISLQKALLINPNNQMAKTLIQDIEDTLNESKNKTIINALNWLSDKGIDFLMIFFGIIAGELLVRYVNDCQIYANERYILNYISRHTKHKEISLNKNRCKNIFLKIQCFLMINLLSYIITSSVFVLTILIVELLLNVSYLQYIDSHDLWIHIGKLYILASIILFIVKMLLSLFKNKEQDEIQLANILVDYLNRHDMKLLRETLEMLLVLDKEKVDSIFKEIIFDEDKQVLSGIYDKIKQTKKKE